MRSTSRDAFAKPAANLPTPQLRGFTFGNKLFNTNWVTAPASVASLDGLGPTFNRVSCSGCHFKDGRGRPPLHAEEAKHGLLIRLSVPGAAPDGGPLPHPAYGDQLNERAILGVPAEGQVAVTYEEVTGAYADGTPYTLYAPRYRFRNLAFGPLGESVMISPRVAPFVFGAGLLEAIPDAALLARADPQDADGDGISGRVNRVPGPDGALMIGRFGWKANVATLRQQSAAAALGDIGLTSGLHPQQNCPPVQTACRASVEGGTPEMSDKQLDTLTFYMQTLAVPARRDVEHPDVVEGARVFEEAGCVACHTPQLATGAHPVAGVGGQRIQPFTDLLLHDMGEGLADGRPDYAASGSEWRTPPLWGIGLVNIVNQHTRFLHDGRARSLEEAVLWHGGEAARAQEYFRRLPREKRAALLRFLESL